jgi:hypothetical protein
MPNNPIKRLVLGLLPIEPLPVDDAASILLVDREKCYAVTRQVVEEVRAERGFDLEVGEVGLDDGASGRDLRPGDRDAEPGIT